MKRLCAVLATVTMLLSMSACKDMKKTQIDQIEKIAPDQLVTVEAVSTITGVDMTIDENGVTTDGNASSVTYVADPAYSGDPVTIRIEQFSKSLSDEQIWDDYESARIKREDMEYVEGIGQDCYIAFPYINVFNRGCYIRITAGSGNDANQKELLESLASIASAEVERVITAEAYESATSNVIE